MKNIILRNFELTFSGGVKEYNKEVKEEAQDYPEVYVYGKIMPAKGIYFRHIENLKMGNIKISTEIPDSRENFVYSDVSFAK